jgi:predicted dehydrogenase
MIKIGVAGYGYWGPNLVRNFSSLNNCLVKWCVDLDRARVEKAAKICPGINTSADYKDILRDKDVDAVVIATPAATHYGIAKDALEAGKHIFIEKPFVLKSEEGVELIKLAKAKKRLIMVGHTFEYNPAVRKVRELISSGAIGDLHYLYSTRVNLGIVRSDTNALWNLAPHDISIFIYVTGLKPVKVRTTGSSYIRKEIEDTVFMTLDFPNNVSGHIHASWLDPGKIREMTVVGTKKMIVYDDLDNEAKVKIYDKGVFVKEDEAFRLAYRYGDITMPLIDSTEPLKVETSHFLECIEEEKTPLSDGESGLRVVKVLEAAQRSLKNDGIPVEIRY